MHKFRHCKCTYTYGDIVPCDEYAQGPYNPILVTETLPDLDARVDGVDYRGLNKVQPTHPYHPFQFLCERVQVIKEEAPQENCPLCGPRKNPRILEVMQKPVSSSWLPLIGHDRQDNCCY